MWSFGILPNGRLDVVMIKPSIIKCLDKSDAWLVQFMTLSHGKGISQSVIADFLRTVGYTSMQGKPLSASHVSNFEKDHLGLSRTIEYKKPNYPMNHLMVKKLTDADCFDLKTKIEDDEELTKEDFEKAERGGATVCNILLQISEYYRSSRI